MKFLKTHKTLVTILSAVLLAAAVAVLLFFLLAPPAAPTPAAPNTDGATGGTDTAPPVPTDWSVPSIDSEPLPAGNLPTGVGTMGALSYQIYEEYIAITDCDPASVAVDVPAEIEGKPVMSIARQAFSGCAKMKEISLHPNLRHIGAFAFSGCEALSAISIPETCHTIEENAFLGCVALTDVTVPGSVKVLGEHAFTDTPFYTENTDEWVVVGDNIVIAYRGKGGDLITPKGMKKIASLGGNLYITGLHVLEGVTELGNYAFAECANIASLALPSTLEHVGVNAFAGCSFLLEIAIPEGVESIGDGAFSYCENLKSVSIPESVLTIGAGLFSLTETIEEIHVIAGSNAESFFLSSEYADLVVSETL